MPSFSVPLGTPQWWRQAALNSRQTQGRLTQRHSVSLLPSGKLVHQVTFLADRLVCAAKVPLLRVLGSSAFPCLPFLASFPDALNLAVLKDSETFPRPWQMRRLLQAKDVPAKRSALREMSLLSREALTSAIRAETEVRMFFLPL